MTSIWWVEVALLISILQGTGQPLQPKIDEPLNAIGAKVKKPCSMEKGIQVYCIIYFFQLFCRVENLKIKTWGCVEDPYGFAKCLGFLKHFRIRK